MRYQKAEDVVQDPGGRMSMAPVVEGGPSWGGGIHGIVITVINECRRDQTYRLFCFRLLS